MPEERIPPSIAAAVREFDTACRAVAKLTLKSPSEHERIILKRYGQARTALFTVIKQALVAREQL